YRRRRPHQVRAGQRAATALAGVAASASPGAREPCLSRGERERLTIVTHTLRAGGRGVPLLAGPGALQELPLALAEAGFEGRLFVVADRHAAELHRDRLRSVLGEAPVLCISGDEAAKTLAELSTIWDWLVDNGAQRRDALVGFGGGVVCDMVGFA